MQPTNRSNLRVYRLWAPVYDALFGALAARGRRQACAALDVPRGGRVLLPGVGTGADLPLLPPGVTAVGVDLSPAMLARARRAADIGRTVVLIRADVQALPLRDGACDAALLSLIVSVAPDGQACLREAARAVRPGAPLVIFDKFLADEAAPGVLRRMLNGVTRRLGTDINRRLRDILAGSGCSIVRDEPSILRGAYRVIVTRAGTALPKDAD